MARPTVTVFSTRPARPALVILARRPSTRSAVASPANSITRKSVTVVHEASQRAAAVAQRTLTLAEEGYGLFGTLEACARAAGVKPDSEEFDEAAALVGLPYCRVLDLYVDPETKRRAEELGFTKAHQALIC
jgi:hypothetical protein